MKIINGKCVSLLFILLTVIASGCSSPKTDVPLEPFPTKTDTPVMTSSATLLPVEEWDKQVQDVYFTMMVIQMNVMELTAALNQTIKAGLVFEDYVKLIMPIEDDCIGVDIQRQQIQPPDSLSSVWNDAIDIHMQIYDVTLQTTSGYRLLPKDGMERVGPLLEKVETLMLTTEGIMDSEYGLNKQELAVRRNNVLQNNMKEWLQQNGMSAP